VVAQVNMATKAIKVTKVTVATKVACGFPTQPFTRAETTVGLHVKCPLLLFDLNKNRNVSINFRKNSSMSNYMETRSAVLELIHA
jgi:hypothetical protein